MDELVKSVEEESMEKVKRKMNNLYSIWDKIGIKAEKKASRCRTAWNHVIELTEEIFNEEEATYNNLLLRVKDFSEEISELSKQLSVPCDEEIEGTLLTKEETLRKKVHKLKEMKEIRLKKFNELRNLEHKYCKILDWAALEVSSKTGVPSEQDVTELEQYVSVLQKERNHRFQRLCSAKRELTTILEVTEIQPEMPFEKKILSSSEDTITLTDETFGILEEILKKVRSKRADLENQRKALLKTLNNLWDRLQIPENERKLFLSQHQDYKVSTLKSITDEIEKCEELKRQNLKKYICNLREELSSLWKECFASEEEKANFLSFKSDEFTEENLKAHEMEVEKWRTFYDKIESIRKKIEKRNQLWDLLTVFENKARDPNRFKNRRGNLLKEERERKKLGEDLPDLENEIFLDIENFEEENGVSFRYHGENYRDYVVKQWEERRMQKENEKIMRHQKRMLQVENEVTLGTTPNLKRTLCATPRNTPSKFLKTSLSVGTYRTPLVSATKNSPRSAGKQSCTKLSSVRKGLPIGTQQRAALQEKPQNNLASGSSDDTTYSIFAGTVNKSSRYLFRSSVLSSKKTVGTRISAGSKYKRFSNSNKSKQRNSNKSLRRSTRNNVSGKITPARGNLGLPFLI